MRTIVWSFALSLSLAACGGSSEDAATSDSAYTELDWLRHGLINPALVDQGAFLTVRGKISDPSLHMAAVSHFDQCFDGAIRALFLVNEVRRGDEYELRIPYRLKAGCTKSVIEIHQVLSPIDKEQFTVIVNPGNVSFSVDPTEGGRAPYGGEPILCEWASPKDPARGINGAVRRCFIGQRDRSGYLTRSLDSSSMPRTIEVNLNRIEAEVDWSKIPQGKPAAGDFSLEVTAPEMSSHVGQCLNIDSSKTIRIQLCHYGSDDAYVPGRVWRDAPEGLVNVGWSFPLKFVDKNQAGDAGEQLRFDGGKLVAKDGRCLAPADGYYPTYHFQLRDPNAATDRPCYTFAKKPTP